MAAPARTSAASARGNADPAGTWWPARGRVTRPPLGVVVEAPRTPVTGVGGGWNVAASPISPTGVAEGAADALGEGRWEGAAEADGDTPGVGVGVAHAAALPPRSINPVASEVAARRPAERGRRAANRDERVSR